MRILVIAILALGVTASATAGEKNIHNFVDVLGMRSAAFEALCSRNDGKVKRDGKTASCLFKEKSDVHVAYEKGVVSAHGIRWDDSLSGLSLLSAMRKESGDADLVERDEDCRKYTWVLPEGYIVLIGICPSASFVAASEI